ncbi:hypothetical protein FA13DRAFT_1635316 [Coprinellus micaceus]|uniref:CxC5 like cysteine cluster associated with KDZ domain-containing protein n=1 Tax=Coprinellus micaceus TaxID=71717 RepID=A0A4Y7SYQ1_COPMI|nr:hypothetical protein FA13DRAFT_1635316 [Coprinellus micaceus]
MCFGSTLGLACLLLLFFPLVSAAPTSPFPNIPFSEFSSFISGTFSPDISLATVLVLLFSLTDNPELLNLHGRQQHSKVNGNKQHLVSTWMKMFSRLLLSKNLRAVRTELFHSADHIYLDPSEPYTPQSVTALSKKLDSLVSALHLGAFNTSGKLCHRRQEILYEAIEPLRLILLQSYECDSEGCSQYSLSQNTKFSQVPQVALARGADAIQAWVLHGHCEHCGTSYYADHTRFRNTTTQEWQRSMLSGAHFVKLGQSTWADRTFTSSVLNATYSFHASTSAFAEFWSTSFGLGGNTTITRRHVWQAFVSESISMVAQDQQDNPDLVVADSADIDEVTTTAFTQLGNGGVIQPAQDHACDECSHKRRFSTGEQHLDPDDYDPVTMCVVDGIVMSPTHCAHDDCQSPLANARGEAFCEYHCQVWGNRCRHQREWTQYQESHSRANLAGVRRMISRPQEQVPWQNPRRNAEVQAHDQPAPEDDDAIIQKAHYFGPSKYYCTETACYPCGAVLAWALFDRSESPTNILHFLASLFPTPESRPTYICIDKGCQVFRTAVVNGSFETTWKNTRFIVDTYHYSNHKRTDNLCQTWCNPSPLDGSQPNLVIQETDDHGDLYYKRAFNTQACEQLNAWIAGFAGILKRMTIHNFNWFLHAMLYLHTKRVIAAKAAKKAGQAEDGDEVASNV